MSRESELKNMFKWEFDDLNGNIMIAGITFSASDILEELDPIAFNEEYINWLDNKEKYAAKYDWR